MQNRIQILRKEHKLTQNDLAQELEVTRQTIISLESGRYNASLLLAHKIARFFDLMIEDVFIFSEEDEEL
ncbi:helix-turn-helix transcriptional regulator [Enterococcus xiangfangensis]|uniref:Helix-turn-helix transcriptional regulator n=1 Tax=Enterococcus xiangfangensis TaxID=1296537 RepID=A0ABU3FAN4_9ENTE|nr:helix-turn-helix transcriptional regulator [Enterococcus xiangfangensis]MDT2759486.1 helix-turn-helix transcriptional regulator [Enterococcus xiangfangensis]